MRVPKVQSYPLPGGDYNPRALTLSPELFHLMPAAPPARVGGEAGGTGDGVVYGALDDGLVPWMVFDAAEEPRGAGFIANVAPG